MARAREILEKYGRGQYNHMFELDRRYPEVRMFGDRCISAEVRPGWTDLVEEGLRILSENGCTVGQIKQKFGGLRFYWNYPDRIEDAMDAWRKAGPNYYQNAAGEWVHDPPMPFKDDQAAISAVVDPVIRKIEAESYLTCEDCSARLEKGGPCYRTQCDSCAGKPL